MDSTDEAIVEILLGIAARYSSMTPEQVRAEYEANKRLVEEREWQLADRLFDGGEFSKGEQ